MLTDQLAGVREELRLQREQANRYHEDLKWSLARMEERDAAAEKRADMEAQARAKAKEQVADLISLYRRLKDKESSFNDKNDKTQGRQPYNYH